MAKQKRPVKDQVVLISGAARGIGAATAQLLHEHGAKLALVGVEPELLAAQAAAYGDRGFWAEADVTDRDALKAAIDGAAEHYGRIDAVIANAGVGYTSLIDRMPVDQFEQTINVNIVGVWNTLMFSVPHLRKSQGYAIPIASAAAMAHTPLLGAYSATKAAVEALADTFRQELAPHGVGVGCAYFGFIDTDMVRRSNSSRPARELRASMRQNFISKRIDKQMHVSKAAQTLHSAIQQRSRFAIAPRWMTPLVIASTLPHLLVEFGMRQDKVDSAILELDKLEQPWQEKD